MDTISRRTMLAATAGGALLPAVSAAAQPAEPIPQPQRLGAGGTDPGSRNLMVTDKIQTFSSRRRPITAPCPTCASRSRTLICG